MPRETYTNMIEKNNDNFNHENLIRQEKSKNPEDFTKKVKLLISSLEEARTRIETGEKNLITTYGEINESTSNGKELVVHNLMYNLNEKSPQGSLTLIAKDKISNKIVGLRLQQMDRIEKKDKYPNLQNNKISVGGLIIIGERGEGIATALDNALVKTLQKIINDENKNPEKKFKISWEVLNKNQVVLSRLMHDLENEEENGNKEKILELKDAIELKKLEQERWQALYSENGKFGMTMMSDVTQPFYTVYEKEITPDVSTDNENAKNVTLSELDKILDELYKSI
jgi:hypothetical protein